MRAILKNAVFLSALIMSIPAAAGAEILLNVDFDGHPLGPYTAEMGLSDFHYTGYTWQHGMNEGRGEIVAGRDGQGKALRMLYPAGTFGANEQAVQIRAALSRAVDTAWVSYWVMFESGFDFVKGGKLPGLCGGECITGGREADGYNGWSARVMWRRGGIGEQYLYYTANEGYGESLLFDRVKPKKRFIPGQWHRVNTQIIMNTPGEADGVVRTWFDGELSVEKTDALFRHTDELKIDLFYISTFFGGSDQTWAPSVDTYITFDDFLVISKPESSPYPQALYELSAVSGRLDENGEFTVNADLTASLGSNLMYSVSRPGYPLALDATSLAPQETEHSAVYSEYDLGVSQLFISAGSYGPYRFDYWQRDIYVLDERGLLCDSAWQAMPLADTLRSGDRLKVYLAILDPEAKIMIGPTITDAPVGEYQFYGVLKYENGMFSAIDGNTYIDGMPVRTEKLYEIEFTFDFPTTYSVSVRDVIGCHNPFYCGYDTSYTWTNLSRRGYAASVGSYGTWASRDHAGMVRMRLSSWSSVDNRPNTSRAQIKAPAARPRPNGIMFNMPAPSQHAQIEIFNAKGALVKRVPAGSAAGASMFVPVPSKGLYLYRIKSGVGRDVNTVRGSVIVR